MMIELIPALDLLNGQCVRLLQGDFTKATLYDTDPVNVACSFAAQGFRRLHLVDLDGARKGRVVNGHILAAIAAATDLEIDFSGGIKTTETVRYLFNAGASWLGIGSIAVSDPALCLQWQQAFGNDAFMIAADAAGGRIVINGWQNQAGLSAHELIARYYESGARRFFCTDTTKDGMLGGPATQWYKTLLREFPDLYLIASGGVSSVADIHELEQAGCSGVIIGKALYEGRLNATTLQPWL